jgi:hypothetical protein
LTVAGEESGKTRTITRTSTSTRDEHEHEHEDEDEDEDEHDNGGRGDPGDPRTLAQVVSILGLAVVGTLP